MISSKLKRAGGARAREDLIVISEVVRKGRYKWPDKLPRTTYGKISKGGSKLFDVALKGLRRARQQYEWIPIFKDTITNNNALSRLPELVSVLEMLFIDELKSGFSESQRKLLFEADCVLIGYHINSGSIISFGSTRYSPRATIPGVRSQVTHGGIFVVERGHQSMQITSITASIIALYGHSLRSIFQDEVFIVRINNKYVERILRRAEPVFRSDQLTSTTLEETRAVKLVMLWTHENVFHSEDCPLVFGEPLQIEHWFEPKVRMDGLNGREIVYAVRRSSLAYFLYRVFTAPLRKKKSSA